MNRLHSGDPISACPSFALTPTNRKRDCFLQSNLFLHRNANAGHIIRRLQSHMHLEFLPVFILILSTTCTSRTLASHLSICLHSSKDLPSNVEHSAQSSLRLHMPSSQFYKTSWLSSVCILFSHLLYCTQYKY